MERLNSDKFIPIVESIQEKCSSTYLECMARTNKRPNWISAYLFSYPIIEEFVKDNIYSLATFRTMHNIIQFFENQTVARVLERKLFEMAELKLLYDQENS